MLGAVRRGDSLHRIPYAAGLDCAMREALSCLAQHLSRHVSLSENSSTLRRHFIPCELKFIQRNTLKVVANCKEVVIFAGQPGGLHLQGLVHIMPMTCPYVA
jgi:hypothetical protein